ncbi:MAG: hypothetical protein ACTSVI_13700 [Promethearchaeota archaeon]
MPKGVCLYQWTDDGYIIRASWHENDASIFENLLMRIAISHEPNKKYSIFPTREKSKILSYFNEFKDKKRKTQKLIVGLELTKEEEPDDYKQLLDSIFKQVQEHLDRENDELNGILYALYISNQELSTDKGQLELIEARLRDKIKKLMDAEKTDEALELLELLKTVPPKIKELTEQGNKLMREKRLDDAHKAFNEAATLAKKIGEDNFAESLLESFNKTAEKPKTLEKIKKFESLAKKAMREEKIKKAAEFFLKASKEAMKINDIDLMDEFMRKSQLLTEFHAIDKSKKRTF